MIDSVQEIRSSGDLLELYSEHYNKRYRVKPILSNNGSDQTIAKDLIRTHGYPKACLFITAFLRSDYWTFTQKKHPLQALVKDINIVNTALESERRLVNRNESNSSIKIRVLLNCDECGGAYEYVGSATGMERDCFCEGCFKLRLNGD